MLVFAVLLVLVIALPCWVLPGKYFAFGALRAGFHFGTNFIDIFAYRTPIIAAAVGDTVHCTVRLQVASLGSTRSSDGIAREEHRDFLTCAASAPVTAWIDSACVDFAKLPRPAMGVGSRNRLLPGPQNGGAP